MSRASLIESFVIGALIIWLAADAIEGAQHQLQIANAIQRGEVGAITPEEQATLSARISDWLKMAKVATPFALNQPPRRGRLNIYITTPAAFRVTGVDYGNARYDPTLDAIYIDHYFLERNPYTSICYAAGESSITGCRDDMPSQQMLFAFIFHHELGHRQLHGMGVGAFGMRQGDPRLRQMEAEADAFAIKALKNLYGAKHSVVHDPDNALSDVLGFSSFDGDPSRSSLDRFWVDLLGTLVTASTLNAFLSAPYSPFYHDLAHPSLYDRTAGMFDAALSDPNLPPKATAQLRFFHDLFKRQAMIPELPFVELRLPEPSVDVTFSGEDLLVRAASGHGLFYVSQEELEPHAGGGAAKVLIPRPYLHGPEPSGCTAAQHKSEALPVFWGISETAVLAADDDSACLFDRGSVKAAPFPVSTNHCFSLWTGPVPSDYALTLTCDAQGADILTSITPEHAIATRPLDAITADVRRTAHDATLSLEVSKDEDRSPSVMLADRKAYIPVTAIRENHTLLTGVAVLDVPRLSVIEVILPQIPDSLRAHEPARALFPAVLSGSAAAMLTSSGGGLPELYWGIWSTSTNAAPALLVSHPFLIARYGRAIGAGTLADFDPYLVDIQTVGPNAVTVNFGGDGVFLADLRHQSVHLLYGFGGTPFHVVASKRGRIALFVRGGGKIFVFPTSAADDSK